MKKIILVLSMACLLVSLAGCAAQTAGGGSTPELRVANPAKLDANGKLTIIGSGFKAGSEITLLFTTQDGIENDIGYALSPAPKAADDGSWQSTWDYGRLVKKKLVIEGNYHLIAADSDLNPICRTKVVFAK